MIIAFYIVAINLLFMIGAIAAGYVMDERYSRAGYSTYDKRQRLSNNLDVICIACIAIALVAAAVGIVVGVPS